MPTAASSPGLCPAVPSPGMPPLLDTLFHPVPVLGSSLPPQLDQGVLRVGVSSAQVLARVPGTDPRHLGVLVSDQVHGRVPWFWDVVKPVSDSQVLPDGQVI